MHVPWSILNKLYLGSESRNEITRDEGPSRNGHTQGRNVTSKRVVGANRGDHILLTFWVTRVVS